MAEKSINDLLRQIPSVDALLQDGSIQAALAAHPRKLVLEAIRQVLDETRKRMLQSDDTACEACLRDLPGLVLARLARLAEFTLRRVVNATGIVIHTNLGRSLLPEQAVERLRHICGSYNNLEYDLDRGERGSRYVHAEEMIRELTGAEAALVVNNNAAAVFLALNTIASGREVVVSRGQLVEIGGSFRIPDVMSASGAALREVGTTNRTHLKDYAAAINDRTALLLKVHTSNYKIIGFTAEVGVEELVGLGRERGLPVMEDLGSGCLIDPALIGIHGEPPVQEIVRAGADLVTFSGDKLLGGPQAGIMAGRKDLIACCRKNPITRALRVDKMTLAALEATLRLYRDPRQAAEYIPTLRMIAVSPAELDLRAKELAGMLNGLGGSGVFEIEVRQSCSQVGGGSLPALDLPTRVVAVRSNALSPNGIEERLRRNAPPVIGRIESDCFIMDVRTVMPFDLEAIRQAFERLLAGVGS